MQTRKTSDPYTPPHFKASILKLDSLFKLQDREIDTSSCICGKLPPNNGNLDSDEIVSPEAALKRMKTLPSLMPHVKRLKIAPPGAIRADVEK